MSNTVITSSDIQVAYEQFYLFMMQYLWEFPVVQDLANLEIAIFKRFPDKEEMQKCLRELNYSVSATYTELEQDDKPEFKEAYETLEYAINDFEDPGCELYSVQEILNDDGVEASIDATLPESDKEKFEFGDITKTTKAERELQEEAARTLSNPFENPEEE